MDWSLHAARMLAVIGEDLSYTPLNGVSRTVRGEFRIPASIATVGIGMQATDPVLTILGTDLPDAGAGDTLVRGGITYTVVSAEPDGTAFTRLILQG